MSKAISESFLWWVGVWSWMFGIIYYGIGFFVIPLPGAYPTVWTGIKILICTGLLNGFFLVKVLEEKNE